MRLSLRRYSDSPGTTAGQRSTSNGPTTPEDDGGNIIQFVGAPGLQPNETGPATTADHSGGMVGALLNRVVESATKRSESLPDLKPWREVRWIFKDGEAVAIERMGDQTRVRREAI